MLAEYEFKNNKNNTIDKNNFYCYAVTSSITFLQSVEFISADCPFPQLPEPQVVKKILAVILIIAFNPFDDIAFLCGGLHCALHWVRTQCGVEVSDGFIYLVEAILLSGVILSAAIFLRRAYRKKPTPF